MGVKVTKTHRVIKQLKLKRKRFLRKLMNNSLYGRLCMNPLHFLQSKFLHKEEKAMKSISKPTFNDTTRNIDYSQIENTKKKKEFDSPVYVCNTILELSKLHMYDVFCKIRQSSLKDLQFHCMDIDSFVLSFFEGNVDNELMDLSNLEQPIKTSKLKKNSRKIQT